VTKNFARCPEAKPHNRFLRVLFHTMSIPGYCIPIEIKMQILSVIPYFTQNTPKRGVNRHFPAKRAKYSNFSIMKTTAAIPTNTTKYLHGWSKNMPHIPRWRTAAILIKIFSNHLNDINEILHSDAYWPSRLQWLFKNLISKNLRWRMAAIL